MGCKITEVWRDDADWQAGGPPLAKSGAPAGGWNATSFIRDGAQLIMDTVRVARYSRARAEPGCAAAIKGLIEKQFLAVEKILIEGPAAINKEADEKKRDWAEILLLIFAAYDDATVRAIMLPFVQNMAQQGFDKTNALMGGQADASARAIAIAGVIQRMNIKLTSVNTTTAQQIIAIIQRGEADGLFVSQIAKLITETASGMSLWRAEMIARTELNNAYSYAAIEAMRAAPKLTHVSVIGCTGVDDSENFFDFRHTCNIQNVPIERAHELTWHVNHTGVVVGSRFLE